MLSRADQLKVLSELDTRLDVQDVYFFRDKLYVLNDYDVATVEQYLQSEGLYEYVEFAVEDMVA